MQQLSFKSFLTLSTLCTESGFQSD